jgi:SPP1 gp7 family putative phage head morphogenesis protein
MSPLEQELARQRARLLEIEQAHVAAILRAYQAVASRLAHDLDALTREIEDARSHGVEVRPGWLFAQTRFHTLLADLAEHTDAFLAAAARTVTRAQREAVQQAFEDGRRLARLALGPASHGVLLRVAGAWDRLATDALDVLIGRAQDGTSLAQLLYEIAPLAPERVRDALAYGVAAGKNPRLIAREVYAASEITVNRALVIARTETIHAHREGVDETWRQTGIVQQWRWSCAKDLRTCPACWAQDGSLHPLNDPMASHPCCRCARLPATPSWADLGFHGIPDRRPTVTTGPQAFRRLSQADKLAILGRAKLEAYNAGLITLEDLVQHTHSPRWGRGSRVASLAEALA